MGKISPVSAKYIIHATIEIEGIVDRPDVIGAIFGQTEGLLGADLELRELQRSGRIGRIEVNVDTRGGKTNGKIIVPSSLDKAETAIVGAALEIIQRIGPCNAKIKVGSIEDVRVSKRSFVIERAKQLLKILQDTVLPDSQEISDEVAYSVRAMEITEFGKDRLPAGPNVDESEEVIVVEGRADVLNLLKHGFKNVIALNGTSVPDTIVELSKKKVITAFVDGDRGGNLIIRELSAVGEIDFVCKAPDGKEVEEITKKEIHKALRSRVPAEQAKFEIGANKEEDRPRSHSTVRPSSTSRPVPGARPQVRPAPGARPQSRPQSRPQVRPAPGARPQRPAYQSSQAKKQATDAEKTKFREMLEDLIGTRGAYILDEKMNILGKVPITELVTTVKSLTSGVYAVVFDGVADRELTMVAEKSNINFVVAMDTKVKKEDTRVSILVESEL